MAEEERQEEKQVEEAAAGGFLGGVRGWVILIVAEVLTVLFFVVLLRYKEGAGFREQAEEQKAPQIEAKHFNKYHLKVSDLNYSVRVQTGQTRTLAMELQIVLGLLPKERRQEVTISEEDWQKFMDALRSLEPFIRDKLQQYISQQTHDRLISPAGQEKIKAFVKEYVNSELEELDLDLSEENLSKQRVTNVLLLTYYMQ